MRLPLINLNNMAITANTNRICINPLRLNQNTPNSQPITKIIAIIYNMLLITYLF